MPTPSASPDATTGVLARLGVAVGETVDLASPTAPDGPGALDLEALLDLLASATSAVARLEAVQVQVAEQLEGIDITAATGWASVKDLLTHLTGGRKGVGGGIVRLAEQTRDLPAVRRAMLAGVVSTHQARTIARRVATLPAAPELRQDAAAIMLTSVREHGLDAADLDRTFDSVVKTLDPDGSLMGAERAKPQRERAAHHCRFLSLSPDGDGGVTIKGYACVEDAELIRTTLTPLTVPQTTEPGACGGDPHSAPRIPGTPKTGSCPDPACTHDGRDPRDHGVRLLDALVETCRRAQAADTGPQALPRDHGTAARVTVTISYDDLRAGLGHGLLGSGESLSAHAVRRLACDAELIPAVLGSQGQVLDVGRTQRLVTTGLWQALVLRDHHCSFPGCTRPPQACDAHHLKHWADGGATSLDNLTLLCRRHHTLTHHSPWTVHLDPTTRRPVWTPPPPRDWARQLGAHRLIEPSVPPRPVAPPLLVG